MVTMFCMNVWWIEKINVKLRAVGTHCANADRRHKTFLRNEKDLLCFILPTKCPAGAWQRYSIEAFGR